MRHSEDRRRVEGAVDDKALKRAIAACLPHGVAMACHAIESYREAWLYPSEEQAVARAVPRRQAAFRAGRHCAREALVKLGCVACAIPVGDGRAPMWPDGFVGSISHSPAFAAAIVGCNARFVGLGLDVEEGTPLEASVARLICREDEPCFEAAVIACVQSDIDWQKLVFVVKEAVFKCYFPVVRRFLDFKDVAVTLDLDRFRFRAVLVNPACPGIDGRRVVEGRFSSVGDHLIAIAAVDRCSDRTP